MKLFIKDRGALLGILPREGNIVTVRVLSEMRKELGISEDEAKDIGLKTQKDGDQVVTTWDVKKDTGKDVTFGDVALGIIREQLSALNKADKLNEDHLRLWSLFMEDRGDDVPG